MGRERGEERPIGQQGLSPQASPSPLSEGVNSYR